MIAPPAPGIAEPQRREHLNRRGLRAAIAEAEADEDVFRLELGVLHHHVEIAPLVEDPGVDQLILHLAFAPPPVLLDQLMVRVCRLRVLIEIFQDRKSTRLNSSHLGISYAVFCLKKKIINTELAYPSTMRMHNVIID